MKSKSKIILIFLILVILCSISAVSSANNNSEIITANNDINENLNINDTDILNEQDSGTFNDLNNKINNIETNEIILENDYIGSNEYNDGKGVEITRDDVIIDGKGHTIDATHSSRIFNISGNDITLKNIRFINGNSDYGGAIFAISNVNIVNCTFINNNATTGGAIYLYTHTSAIVNSTFTDNNAKFAGALFTIELNKIYIINSTFSRNNASSGGAIYSYYNSNNESGEEIIDGCKFINNTADEASVFVSFLSKAKIRNSIILNNPKPFVIFYGANLDADYNWFGNTFDNKDEKPADHINIQLTKWLFLDVLPNYNSSSTISINNIYDSETGENSIYNVSNLPAVNVSIRSDDLILSSNSIGIDNSGKGQINYNQSKDAILTVQYEDIELNKHLYFGDFAKLQKMVSEAEDNTIIRLTRDYVYGYGDTIQQGIRFENKNNITIDANGHTIDARGMSRVFLVLTSSRNIVFKNINIINGKRDGNSIEDFGAGLVAMGSFTKIINCTFKNNTAGGLTGGGAIHISGHNCEIINSTFIDNSHHYSVGGAIYLREPAIIKNTKFIRNTANNILGGGGAIYIANEQNEDGSDIENCIFINNTAQFGGAINSDTWGTRFTHVYNCTFIGNTAWTREEFGGGAISAHEISILESTFIANMAKYGAAIENGGNHSTIDKCVFINNTGIDDEKASSIVFFYYSGHITNSIFLNNNVFGFTISNLESGIVVNNNWFGNTWKNYGTNWDVTNVAVMENWLFLNSSGLTYDFDSEKLTFKINFLSYHPDSGLISNYDYVLPEVTFKISSEDVTFDKDSIKINEEIIGKAKYKGNILVEYENVKYTVPYLFQKESWIEVNSTLNIFIDQTSSLDDIIQPIGEANPFIKEPYQSGIVTYSSNDTSIAKVDKTGKVTAVKEGLALITIKYNGLNPLRENTYLPSNATVLVNVTRIPTHIIIRDNEVSTVNVGDSGSIGFGIRDYKDNYVSGSLNYYNNDSTILNFASGSYRALYEGVANIIVSFDGNAKYLPCDLSLNITVSKKETTIVVNDEYIDLNITKTHYTGARIPNVSGAYLTYESNDTSIAICENGAITAIGIGVAKITITFEGNYRYKSSVKEIIVNVTAVETHLELESDVVDLNVTDYYDLPVVLKDSYGNTLSKFLWFETNDENIVSCAGSYTLNAHAVGQAIITITYRGENEFLPCNASVTVNVHVVETEIIVNPTFDIYVGDAVNLNASLNYYYSGVKLTYASEDSSIVTVDRTGKITAKKVGKTNIIITHEGNEKFLPSTANVTVTVDYVPTEIKVNKTFGLIVFEGINLGATLDPKVGLLTYISSNESVVKVNNAGTISAVGKGTANITISYAGSDKYASATQTVLISVYEDYIPTEIEIENETIELYVTDKVPTGAELNPNNAGQLTYLIDNPEVISIENGFIIAKKEGTATVTFSFEGNGRYGAASDKTLTVTVKVIATEINVDENEVSLYVDDNVNVNASLNYPEAGMLSYNSSDENIATVDADGNIKAVGEGACQINISYTTNGKYLSSSKIVTVTVSRITTTITVDDETITLNLTDTGNVKATLTPTVGDELTYTSSNESVIIINSEGILTTVGEGSATITIDYNGNNKYLPSQAQVTVIVKTVPISISADSDEVALYVGDNVNVNASLNYPEAGMLSYSSSDDSVATVDADGNIKAVGEGTCTINISISNNGKYLASEKIITVKVSKIPTEINVDKTEITLYVDENVNVNATCEFGNLTYITSDENIATIDDKGNVVAKSEGTVTLKVHYAGDNKYNESEKEITLTVSRIPTEIIVDDEITLEIGSYIRFNVKVNPSGGNDLVYEYDEGIIEIDENGYINPVASGEVNVLIKYLGNEKYAPSQATVKVTVTPRQSQINVKEEIATAVGDQVDLNPVLILTGLVGNEKLVYSSNDTDIVTVDENGRITAHKKGHATITIIYEGYKYGENYVNYPSQATVNVTVVEIHTILEVNTNHVEIQVGQNRTITATLTPSVGAIKFTSSDESIATVDENGKITALTRGTVTITVSYEGSDDCLPASQTVIVTVSPIPTSIDVVGSVILVMGEKYTLNPILSPSPGPFVYHDDGDGVAYVDSNGVITAGQIRDYTIITVEFEGNSTHASSTRNVVVQVTLNSTSITANDTFELEVGKSTHINAQLTPSNVGELIYESNNPSVARVDSNGMVRALKEGTAIITVSYAGNMQYEPCEKNVTVKVSKVKNPENSFSLNDVEDSKDAVYSINLPTDADGTFTVMVDGKEYKTETLVGGSASIKVEGLTPGDHQITLIYSGDNKYGGMTKTETLHVYNIEITKNTDLKAMYPNSVTYTVHLSKDTQIMAGKTVTFKINGKTFQSVTDKLGYASVKLSLAPKTYIITAEYAGVKVTNKVTFTHIIKAKNLKVKKSAKKLKIKVTLNKLNNKYLKGKKITLKFKGKKYKAKTNKKGVATFIIKKNVLNKLKDGKKYKYTVIYAKDKLTKTIKVKK